MTAPTEPLCRYCQCSLAGLPTGRGGKRKICTQPECRRLDRYDRLQLRRMAQKAAGKVAGGYAQGWEPATYDTAEREQGAYHVPSAQHKLDPYVVMQKCWCPACGLQHPLSASGRMECTCGALWTMSVGYTVDGKVAVVRMDRWR